MKINKKTKILWLAGFMIGSSLFAQEIEETKLPDASGSTVVLEKEINALNVQTLVELLNKLPGVRATESSISLQGSSTSNVMVLMDGRPLNDPLTGSVNLSGISSHSIKQIEIVKGAGSVLYGNNTSGGVVIISTKKADKAYADKIEAFYGSFDTQKYRMDLGTSAYDTGIAVSGNYERSDGHRINGDSETKGEKIDLNSVIADKIDSKLSFNYSTEESGYAGKIFKPTPHARSEKENFGSILLLKYKGLDSRTYYNTFDDHYADPDIAMESKLNSKTIGEDIKWKGKLPKIGTSLIGLNMEARSAEATSIGKHDESLYGAYAIKEFGLLDWPLSTKIGLRVNDHTEFGSSYNPEAGLIYKKDRWKAGLQVSRSSNTPTIRQRYYESTFTKGNPDLKMEEATNYQLNVSSNIFRVFNWGVTAFYSSIEDGITGLTRDDGIYTYENVSSSTRKGFETSFDWQVNPWLKVDSSYLYLIFKNDDTGLFIPSKPKHKIKSNIYLSHRGWTMNLSGDYVSDSFNNSSNTEILEEYFVADAKISYNYKKMNFYIEVENLLDKEYEVHVGYPAAGRAYSVGMSYAF